MTPVALRIGWSEGRKASASWTAAAASTRAVTAASVARPGSPPAMAERASAAAARRAPTVASAPNRASSARTAGRWRSSSIDGISLKSDIVDFRFQTSELRVHFASQKSETHI